MNIFKRILKFFFPDKERKADRAQQQVGVPHPPLSSVGKNETPEKKKYRILPDFFSRPGLSVFRKPLARESNQVISYWDGEGFPKRWRHKLIRHW